MEDLRLLARRRLDAGELPPCKPVSVFGAIGTGTRCALCDATIAAPEVEYEVELAGRTEASTWHFHIRCFEAWRDVCDELWPPESAAQAQPA